jgi:hyperosmotically inducible protein
MAVKEKSHNMHKPISIVPSLGLILALFGGQGSLWAQDPPETQEPADKSSQAAPDNTAKNQRDRNKAAPTADQQKENKSDRELARQVRRALVEDKSLSTYAHNVKVIAQNGEITLRGPVKSAEEKQSIEAKAAEVAGGADKIKSEIEVAPK